MKVGFRGAGLPWIGIWMGKEVDDSWIRQRFIDDTTHVWRFSCIWSRNLDSGLQRGNTPFDNSIRLDIFVASIAIRDVHSRI